MYNMYFTWENSPWQIASVRLIDQTSCTWVKRVC